MTFACKIEQNTPVFSCPFLWYKFYSGLKVDPRREGVMFGFHVGCQKKKIAKANVFKYCLRMLDANRGIYYVRTSLDNFILPEEFRIPCRVSKRKDPKNRLFHSAYRYNGM